MLTKINNIIIPPDLKPAPSTKEISAAIILAKHFQKKVYFVKRSNHKTPDFYIDRRYWELKTPTGKGKHNIQHALQKAATQSSNVVLDVRQSKIHSSKLLAEIRFQFSIIKKLNRVIVITKKGQILDFSR